MPAPSPSTPKGLAIKQKYNKALDLRLAGWTYREIEKETGIDYSNLGKYFRSYLNKDIEGKHALLFNEKDEMLRKLYRLAYESATKFIPVLDSKGQPITHPLYDHNGDPVLNSEGEPIQIVMRDEGAMLNALASASKIAAQLIALHGLNAPVKSALTMTNEGPDVITFRVVEGRDGRMVEPVAPSPAAPMPASPNDIAANDIAASDIGATSATENIVGGVEVVTFDIDLPTTLPAPPLKYMD